MPVGAHEESIGIVRRRVIEQMSVESCRTTRYAVRASELDSGFTTASQCVNRLAHVIQAPPGYVTLEKLPKLTFRSQICV